MTKTDYDDAFMDEEGTRLRLAIFSAIEDYVRYFESRGFQIRPSWITDAHYAVQFPAWIGMQPEELMLDFVGPTGPSGVPQEKG